MNPDLRPTPGRIALWGTYGLLILAYPFLADAAIESYGVRAAAVSFAVLGITGYTLARRQLGRALGLGTAPSFAIAAFAVIAAVADDERFLRLIPALVNVVLLLVFAASLREPVSIIERVARLVEPHAPEFIRSYCRKVTVAWCALFLVNVAVITWLAFAGPTSAWEAYTGWMMYAAIAVCSVVEFLIRKSWFRYYFYNGPFDRLWSTLLPAENTPQGRRSAEYIRRTRERLARAEVELGNPPVSSLGQGGE
jgi:uncharacterized membrane protein